MYESLSTKLTGKLIICSCEGTAEKVIMELLLENELLCFDRKDLVDNEITMLREGERIAREFLNREYNKDVVILRILDRSKEILKLPKVYTQNKIYEVFNIITKPEIEILHIIAEGMTEEFDKERRHNKQLKASEFCQRHLLPNDRRIKCIKSESFWRYNYENNIQNLILAIKKYHSISDKKNYDFSDLLAY